MSYGWQLMSQNSRDSFFQFPALAANYSSEFITETAEFLVVALLAWHVPAGASMVHLNICCRRERNQKAQGRTMR
jgi:hypothetical protein